MPMVKAFWDYEETRHLLPQPRQRAHALPRYLASDLRDAARFELAFAAVVADEIVGAAAWLPPPAYPVSVGRQLLQAVELAPTLPWTWRTAREARRGQVANRRVHRAQPPHYYLRAIGVDPAKQRHGAGGALLAPVLESADADGVGCFLTTATAPNVAWYRRFGFRVVEEYTPTPTWPTVWAMWRDPGGPI